MSKSRQEIGMRLVSFLAWGFIQFLGHTARFKVKGYDQVKKMMLSKKGFIMAIWHGRTLLPIQYCRGLGIWAITSLSRDGELQTRIISRFGYQIIRGSSGRGGMKAALIACKRLQAGGVLAITPDGPKGPANEVQDGTVFLAQHANCPIIPIGVGIRRAKLMNAWDRYALPLPFCSCSLVFGDPIYLNDEDPDDVSESPGTRIKVALDSVQREAQLMIGEDC